MTRTLTEVHVFVAAPSDVDREREVLEALVSELNRNWSGTLGVQLRLLQWKSDVHPAIGEDAQQVINQQIGDDYDVLIGIFWGRFGEATPRADSGTIEEIERAFNRRRRGSSTPEIMIYFKDAPIPPSRIDPVQLEKIQSFKTSLSGVGALYAPFEDDAGFQTSLRAHLASIAKNFSDAPKLESLVQVAEIELDDDDLGYLDHIDIFQSRMADSTSLLSTITNATERIGSDFTQRTVEIEEFQSDDANADDIKGAKRLIRRAADDMNAYGGILESQLPPLADARDDALTSLTKALSLYGDFGETDDEQLKILRGSLADYKDAVSGAKSGLGGFRASIASLSRMTSDLNRAKRFVLKMLDRMSTELERNATSAANILASIDAMLER